ncbi:phosphoribosylglycinamide formyltransferase [Ascobolus immersus RN42]|uniref:Phosphoribosylglycinamide formyltransferase n=1 Tax=Ascobolus immersus RN42 TaxID=1160509 RepID=A0A3N4ILR3_ASCIM|nr:phosphoribosylglycinamide formyltransferase [Ascobolus immersus RN42]
MSDSTPSILVLISGSGSNLQALIDASQSPRLPGKITHVISNKKSAYGLTRAANHSIPTSYHNLVPYKKQYSDIAEARSVYDADLAKLILEQKPDMVVCAGWMHILSMSFLTPLADANIPIINLHPALPGMFDGARAIERAKEAFERGEISGTGVMVHYVIGEVDRGEPIVVRDVEMKVGESLDDLEARIHAVEHEAIVEGARIVLEKLVKERAGQQ